jgi:hypothetical protein
MVLGRATLTQMKGGVGAEGSDFVCCMHEPLTVVGFDWPRAREDEGGGMKMHFAM